MIYSIFVLIIFLIIFFYNHIFEKKKIKKIEGDFELKINLLDKNILKKDEILDNLNKEKNDFIKKISILETENDFFKKEIERFKKLDETESENRKNLFKNIAQEILNEKSKVFLNENKLNLDLILKPFSEKIEKFENVINSTNKEHIERTISLKTEIKKLSEITTQTNQDAVNLTKALKGDSKIQGNWGEFILESILEKSGLTKDREYFLQNSIKNEEGKLLRPDVIIKLPEEKHVIIDSKVSLLNYEQYINSDDKNFKQEQLKKHIDSIKNHVKDLSQKDYFKTYNINSLDFVLLFIPIESAFSLSLENNSNIFFEAYEKNIIIVSPTTLLATVRTISNIWQINYRILNEKKIINEVSEMYDKFVLLVEDLQKLGNRIKMSSESYEDVIKKISSGRGNLIRRIELIRQYAGIKNSKNIPIEILNQSD
jgi:DNA recombination protein RmuC